MDVTELLNKISFKCSVCNEQHDHEIELLLHIRQEHKIGTNSKALDNFRYVCPKCDRTYRSTEDLLVHAKKVHVQQRQGKSANLEGLRFECRFCSKKFRTMDSLVTHRKIHVQSSGYLYPLKCSCCDRAFKSKQKLDAHVCGHLPYPCEVCNRRFETLIEAERHCAAPFEEKPFLCKICGKNFRLFKHLWIHTKKHEEKNEVQES